MGLIKHLKPNDRKEGEEQESKVHQIGFALSEFNPYAAFYNDHTILTKNGELLQTIKIPLSSHGLPSEEAEHTGVYLRNLIREAMARHAQGPEFSHWMHIFRDRQPIDELSIPPSEFAEELQDNWLGTQRTSYSYYNVCYLTVIAQGQSADLFDMRDFKKGAKKRKNRNYRAEYLDEQYKKLEVMMQGIRQDIEKYFRVERLGMVERQSNGGSQYFSENMEWLHRLANLSEKPMAVEEADLSQQLETSELIFGFDALEARHAKHKRFASIISIKHYHELPVELFDRFLQMPLEMIVTQASHFIRAKTAMGELSTVREVLQHSEDTFVAKQSGFSDIVEANQGNDTDYSRQQTTIMVLTDYYQELDESTGDLQKAIADMGLISVREDIKLEELFWSQLPANFEFIRRPQALPTNKVDGFARLNFYPTGKHNSRWGEPITIMPTKTRTPYLFHLHDEQIGHTAIIDFNSFPDQVGNRLSHFLLAMASKQTSRIMMFDRHGAGEMTTKAMGGDYLRAGGNQHSLSVNPLAMECVPGNQGFLAAWLAMLLDVDAEDTASRDAIRACVGQGWDQQTASEGFAGLVKMMQAHHPAMAEQLRQMMQKPVFGACVSSGLDNVKLDAKLSAINIHIDAFKEGSAVAIFAYLLHRAILSLDGKPTLLVIKDAWDVLEHPFFASRIQSLMDMLTERNAALLFTTRDPDKLAAAVITPIISKGIVTKLIIPDDIPCDYLVDTLGYTETEQQQLLTMERQKGDVLVVHGDEIIATRIEVTDSTKQAILSGDAKALQTMKSSKQ